MLRTRTLQRPRTTCLRTNLRSVVGDSLVTTAEGCPGVDVGLPHHD